MHEAYRNIYQSARQRAGMTQEAAAEKLNLSVESLRLYETGRREPGSDTASHMADLYGTPYLRYQDGKAKGHPIAALLPDDVEMRAPASAALHLLHDDSRLDACQGDMIAILRDDLVTADEIERWQAIEDVIDDLQASIVSMKLAVKAQVEAKII